MSGGIVDPATGLPRMLCRKCPTCVYRPGNLMALRPGRVQEMEDGAVAAGSWIICHSTLDGHPASPGWQAICRGFFDVRGRDSTGIRLAVALGGPVGVELPYYTTEREGAVVDGHKTCTAQDPPPGR